MIPPFLLSLLKNQLQEALVDAKGPNSSLLKDLHNLKQGDIIEAKVVGQEGAIDILDYGGQRLKAKSQVELPIGAKVRLRVTRPSSPIEVKLEAVVQDGGKARLDPADKVLSRFHVSYSRLKGLVERLASQSRPGGQAVLSLSDNVLKKEGILGAIGISDNSDPEAIKALAVLQSRGLASRFLEADVDDSRHAFGAGADKKLEGKSPGSHRLATAIEETDANPKGNEGTKKTLDSAVGVSQNEDEGHVDRGSARRRGGLQRGFLQDKPGLNSRLLENIDNQSSLRGGQEHDSPLDKGQHAASPPRQSASSNSGAMGEHIPQSGSDGHDTFSARTIQKVQADGQAGAEGSPSVAKTSQEGGKVDSRALPPGLPGGKASGMGKIQSSGQGQISSGVRDNPGQAVSGHIGQNPNLSAHAEEQGQIPISDGRLTDVPPATNNSSPINEMQTAGYSPSKTGLHWGPAVKNHLTTGPEQASGHEQAGTLSRDATSSTTALDHVIVKEFSNHMELAGQLQSHVLRETGQNLFIFPLIFSQMDGVGQWSYWKEEDPQKSRDGSPASAYHISFDLYLNSLGQLNIHIFKNEDRISLFLAAEKDKLPAIRQGLSDITARIKALGYRFENIDCYSLDDEQAPAASSIPFDQAEGPKFHLIT